MADVTRILNALEEGDPHAAQQLLPLVYDELRRLAAQKLAWKKPGQTLQAPPQFFGCPEEEEASKKDVRITAPGASGSARRSETPRSMGPPYSRSPGTPSATNQVFPCPDNFGERAWFVATAARYDSDKQTVNGPARVMGHSLGAVVALGSVAECALAPAGLRPCRLRLSSLRFLFLLPLRAYSGQVPQEHRRVTATRGQGVPVGRKGNGIRRALVAAEGDYLGTVAHRPDVNKPVVAGVGQ